MFKRSSNIESHLIGVCPEMIYFKTTSCLLFTALSFFVVTDAGPAEPTCDPTSQRTFKFVNNCKETVWVGAVGLSPGGWEMDVGGTHTFCAEESFSGRFWPRTGCTFNSSNECDADAVSGQSRNCCATGGCLSKAGSASTWGLECVGGGQSPMTTAEFTVSQSGTDFYDVSVIDGFNVAMEILPIGDFNAVPDNSDPDYWCGNPGGTTPLTGLNSCPWDAVLNEETQCGGHPELRVVDPVHAADANSCASPPLFNGGTNTCQCEDDSDCSDGICGVGNNNIVGYNVCGSFVGCTTGKALCGIGAYFNHKQGQEPCTDGGECASGTCVDNLCTTSPIDVLDCNTIYARTVECDADHICPLLVGMEFGSQEACSCPSGTTCAPINENDAGGLWSCRENCDNGKCTGPSCESNDDCLNLVGTFMLCDTSSDDSDTFKTCVSTNTSLLSATGVSGQSCYQTTNDVTSLCAGCPTVDENNLGSWPSSPAQCTKSNDDWTAAVKPAIDIYKKACPTAYSFPFDDPTSTFQCRGDSGGNSNMVAYQITFCPA
eukprot:Clim_evm2s14 gene=Clim_evmTU2s14